MEFTLKNIDKVLNNQITKETIPTNRYCAFCYNCTGCTDCYDCDSCTDCNDCDSCTDCYDCDSCTDCKSCSFCIGCTNLDSKDYCLLNKQFTKEEYYKVKQVFKV